MTSAAVAVLEREMLECYLARRPLTAWQLGLGVPGGLPPVSTAQVDALAGRYRALLDRVRAAGGPRTPGAPDDAAEPDRLACRLMAQICADEIDSLQLHVDRFTVSPLPEAGLSSALLTFLPYASLGSADDVTGYLDTCAQLPRVLADYAAELAVGRGFAQFPVSALVDRALAQVRTYLAAPIADDPFALPLRSYGASPTALERLSRLILTAVRPAFARLADEFEVPVRDRARGDDHPGICWVTGGSTAYRVLIREHTTLALDPADLHRLGTDLIAQLEIEAVAITARLGWVGDFAAVRDRLRADPALRYRDAQQMVQVAQAAMDRAGSAVPEWITDLPRAGCEVRPMLDTETAHGVLGHYETAPLDRSRPATYWLNTADPRSRPVFEAEALAFHEAIPGHHIEIATSQESSGGSEFRRIVQVLPYTEGWALYCERLADEIGLYSSDVDRLGMVSFDLWRSCRLVVDTGLHEFGWSRDRAVDYLWEHSMLSRSNVVNEVDRYIAHPGSALGYMVGRLAIQQLRNAAVTDSSDRVQLRAFHDRLLRRGPLTLGLLSEQAGVPLTFAAPPTP